MKANYIFRRIIETREKIREEFFYCHNPEYPYLIYRIFDAILPHDDIESRRVLRFIKLPNNQTLAKRHTLYDMFKQSNR